MSGQELRCETCDRSIGRTAVTCAECGSRAGLWQVNEAACPQQWRRTSGIGDVSRLRSFVAYVRIHPDGRREEVARGLAR